MTPPHTSPRLQPPDTRRALFRCVDCGYGASRRIEPERCPMCGGRTWTRERRRGSTEILADDLGSILPGVPFS